MASALFCLLNTKIQAGWPICKWNYEVIFKPPLSRLGHQLIWRRWAAWRGAFLPSFFFFTSVVSQYNSGRPLDSFYLRAAADARNSVRRRPPLYDASAAPLTSLAENPIARAPHSAALLLFSFSPLILFSRLNSGGRKRCERGAKSCKVDREDGKEGVQRRWPITWPSGIEKITLCHIKKEDEIEGWMMKGVMNFALGIT